MDVFRNIGKADITLENTIDFNGGGDFQIMSEHCDDMVANLDAILSKLPESDRDLHWSSSNALWSSSFSWSYFSDGSLSYAARQVLTYDGFSVISYSTFGLSDTRAVFSF